jgi:methionyl-tRNA formyltransferase
MSGSRPTIVFMGTPEFAVPSLQILLDNGYRVKAVVTAPDKPAGRGLKKGESAIKIAAIKSGIPVLQPVNLKDDAFADNLHRFGADLFIVVAFRMLPEKVWSMPPMGTVNLHASLLPLYRGAAPINHAIINGDKITGLTTFLIEKEIDTGNILLQEKVRIDETDTAGSLHDKLMLAGSGLLLRTVRALEEGSVKPVPQDNFKIGGDVPKAPKISKDFCRINWSDSSERIYNFIRGLSPYPAAWTILESGNRSVSLKVYEAKEFAGAGSIMPGNAGMIDDRLVVGTGDGAVCLERVQAEGRKAMSGSEFARGFRLEPGSTCS